MIDLTGQVALITGASRGIGAACATLFAQAGADIGLVYRSRDEEAQSVLREVEALGRRGMLLKGDVAEHATARAHVQDGPVDVADLTHHPDGRGVGHTQHPRAQRRRLFQRAGDLVRVVRRGFEDRQQRARLDVQTPDLLERLLAQAAPPPGVQTVTRSIRFATGFCIRVTHYRSP
ncbi:MAG: SDR family NAD(P)-dependent oxidoreductase [Candidatus Marinimicrobia bacterium]|nr:SDR family NAD(P)-dependent oxidoreductase [Candidatus Neomarinimicrobiota bacterium]